MNLPADHIGLAIIGLFDGCGATVEHPKTFGGPDTPLFRLAKVSSWAEFARKGRPDYLTATLIGAMVEVERWWREGRGYTWASPRQVVSFQREVAPQMLPLNPMQNQSRLDNPLHVLSWNDPRNSNPYLRYGVALPVAGASARRYLKE
jgi:hypothetical protein